MSWASRSDDVVLGGLVVLIGAVVFVVVGRVHGAFDVWTELFGVRPRPVTPRLVGRGKDGEGGGFTGGNYSGRGGGYRSGRGGCDDSGRRCGFSSGRRGSDISGRTGHDEDVVVVFVIVIAVYGGVPVVGVVAVGFVDVANDVVAIVVLRFGVGGVIVVGDVGQGGEGGGAEAEAGRRCSWKHRQGQPK